MAAKKKILKVEDSPTLVRDTFSKAIINTDRTTYNAYCSRKQALRAKDKRLTSLEEEIRELRNMITSLLDK